MNRQKGFTLIELLIVIAIISALAVSVFVALNPVGRLQQARDARRTSDVDAILTSIHEYIVDNNGSLPTGLATNTPISQLGTAASGCSGTVGVCAIASGQSACLNLSTPLAKYLKSIPTDPLKGSDLQSYYAVSVDANNIITVTACGTEGSTVVSASR